MPVYKSPLEQVNNENWGYTKRYKRKNDGKTFLLYPGTPYMLFNIEDDSGESDVLLKDGLLDSDFEFLDQEWEEQ